ncbi:MAG: dihydrofolate reductase [Flavisolibacter sp.]|nr:dihydrofolate reductase [Flavisolibacter sp.]
MRKIIAGFAASVDGYIEGLNGEYDWIIVDEEIDFAAYMSRYDTFLIGRKSYEKMLGYQGPATPEIKNYVFSNTLTEVDKNYLLVRGDTEETVKKLKNAPGKDIAVWGGASLLASLLNLKLVDELSISFIPVLLGQGKPMVEVLNEKIWLSLLDTKRYKNGTLQVTYDVLYDRQK